MCIGQSTIEPSAGGSANASLPETSRPSGTYCKLRRGNVLENFLECGSNCRRISDADGIGQGDGIVTHLDQLPGHITYHLRIGHPVFKGRANNARHRASHFEAILERRLRRTIKRIGDGAIGVGAAKPFLCSPEDKNLLCIIG
jgi:hypothetical protein